MNGSRENRESIYSIKDAIAEHRQSVERLGADRFHQLIESEIPSDRMLQLPCWAYVVTGNAELQKCYCFMVFPRLKFRVKLHNTLSISYPQNFWDILYRYNNKDNDTYRYLSAIENIIINTVANGGKVSLVGFGTFEGRDRKEREGRNPQTGETLTIQATRVPSFKPGKLFKQRVAPERVEPGRGWDSITIPAKTRPNR